MIAIRDRELVLDENQITYFENLLEGTEDGEDDITKRIRSDVCSILRFLIETQTKNKNIMPSSVTTCAGTELKG